MGYETGKVAIFPEITILLNGATAGFPANGTYNDNDSPGPS